ncbi:DNA topoisomerase 4 subunit B [Perkinsela sp. CCAP 1560/4]|nr:DNA topoisomerase 4 subunit B [Perkinsela sp. CCAP 1560/4]|eukprot:KNH07414.1 DNA topoisomerase 4 subunit B [Perkinsela sp. CCAP 1560/4]
MECFLPICLLSHEVDLQYRQRLFFGTVGNAYVNRTDLKEAVSDSWRGLRLALIDSKTVLKENESFFSCLAVDDQAEIFHRNENGLSVLHYAFDGVKIDALVPKSMRFTDTSVEKLLSFKHFENPSKLPIVCSNIIDPPFRLDAFTSTFVKTEKNGFRTLLFSAFACESLSNLPVYDLHTFIESRVKPAQQEYHPHLTIIKYITTRIGIDPPNVDSPFVDIIVVEVADRQSIELANGNFTTIVYIPRNNHQAASIDWDGKLNQIVSHKVIDLTSFAQPIWSLFSKDPGWHDLSDHLLFSDEKIDLGIESSARERRASTAAFFAQALLHSPLQKVDFALFSPSWIRASSLPLTETAGIWRSYTGPLQLCYCEAYGASVWKFLNQTLSVRETANPYQPSGLRYVYDKSMHRTGTLLANVTVWRNSLWKQIARSDLLRFVIPCESNRTINLEGNNILSVFDFSAPSIAHNYLSSRQFKWTLAGKQVKSITGGKPFLLVPKHMKDCPIMTKWTEEEQDCVPCEKGFHQFEPGKDCCLPNPPSIFDNPRLLALIAFSTSFVFLCSVSVLLSWKFYLLQRKRTSYVAEISIAEQVGEYIANLDFRNARNLTSTMQCSSLKIALVELLNVVEHTWKSFPHAVRRGFSEFFQDPSEIPLTVKPKHHSSRMKLSNWWKFRITGKSKPPQLPFTVKDFPNLIEKSPVSRSTSTQKSFTLIDVTFSSTAESAYDPELRRKVIMELYPTILTTAEAHHGTLVSVNPFVFRLAWNAFTHVESHIDVARRCGVTLLNSMRVKSQLFAACNISWLVLIHGGDGTAEIAGDDEFQVPQITGTFVREADELAALHGLFSGKLLWTSYIHEKSRGFLFDRLLRGISLRENPCLLIYESIESLDFMPLQEYNQALAQLSHGEYTEAGKSLEAYMASNDEARKDPTCRDLLAIARVKGPFVRPLTGWQIVKKM